jgi:hypothetical protein
MKIGGVMALKYFFEERWNNIESKEGSEIRNTYVHRLYTNLTVARHQKLKENTQKTKRKRVTRTPPKSGSMDQVHR